MNTDEIPNKAPSDWQPITSKPTLAVLGKTSEELGELIEAAARLNSIIARSIIQGLDGLNPDTLRPNVETLADELADVRALTRCVIKWLGLDGNAIAERERRKIVFKGPWFDALVEQEQAAPRPTANNPGAHSQRAS